MPASRSLKNRGVAYWQADTPAQGQPRQKRVYIATMDAKLHAVDADTGAPCADFSSGGVVNINQWNTQDGKWPLSLLHPPPRRATMPGRRVSRILSLQLTLGQARTGCFFLETWVFFSGYGTIRARSRDFLHKRCVKRDTF